MAVYTMAMWLRAPSTQKTATVSGPVVQTNEMSNQAGARPSERAGQRRQAAPSWGGAAIKSLCVRVAKNVTIDVSRDQQYVNCRTVRNVRTTDERYKSNYQLNSRDQENS